MTNKILVIDCETSPNLVYSWGLFKQNIGINQVVRPSSIISFAAKFIGEKKVHFHSDWTDGHEEMLKAAHALLTEADAVVGYNQDAFDLRRLNGEFLLAGMTPPPPPTSIDLLKVVRKFGFLSNKLAFVGPLLKVGGKVSHEGFSLWSKVLEGDEAAQKRMRRYNIGDVLLTQELYHRVLPFIRNHPHMGTTSKGACGACGSNHLQSRGYRRTKAFKIQRLQCQDCGAWSDGVRSKL